MMRATHARERERNGQLERCAVSNKQTIFIPRRAAATAAATTDTSGVPCRALKDLIRVANVSIGPAAEQMKITPYRIYWLRLRCAEHRRTIRPVSVRTPAAILN